MAMIFNECARDDWIREAVLAGFSQVMLDDPDAPPEPYSRRVADLTAFAHAHGAVSEAEVGTLPHGNTGTVEEQGSGLTSPKAAARFVEQTGIDVLGVSVGNVHVMLKGSRDLDIERLRALREQVDVHFDLHGGTGISRESLREAIALGVTKVCYGTYLKQRYLAAVRKALDRGCVDPHKVLGFGEEDDVMVAGRLAVRDAVLERIDWLGCVGKATGPQGPG